MTPHHRPAPEPRTAAALLNQLSDDLAAGQAVDLVTVPTGFQPLDTVLGGGLRPGEMTLIGGTPGVGKTILAMQWARNLARAGTTVVYACYEHEEADLLVRFLALEMGDAPTAHEEDTEKVRRRMREAAVSGTHTLTDVLAEEESSFTAYENLMRYADGLHLLKGSGRYTGIPELEEALDACPDGRAVLFVDYLQKVALDRDVPDEAEKVTIVTEGLKELALAAKVPVVSIVAADRQGLKSPRLRLHDLRGSSALAFEADVAILLNDKYTTVAKAHRAYDPLRAATFRDWVVLSIEKNRGGPAGVNLEFRKDFSHFRFDPFGQVVTETLVDDKTDVE